MESQILNTDIIEVINETESLNFRTALRKIHSINQSDKITDYSFLDKIIFISYEIFCLDFIWDINKKENAFKKLNDLYNQHRDKQNDFIDLVLLIHSLRENKKEREYEKNLKRIKAANNRIDFLLKEAKKEKNEIILKFIGLFYSSIIFTYLQNGLKKSALESLQKGIDIATQNNFAFNFYVIDSDLDRYLRTQGLYEQILPNLLKTKEFFDKQKNPTYECFFIARLVGEYLFSGANLPGAKLQLESGLAKLNLLPENKEVSYNIKSLLFTFQGIYYFYIGQYKQAIESGQEVKKYAEKLYDEFTITNVLANALGNMGEAYFKMGEFTLSLKYQNDAYTLRKIHSDPFDIAESLYQLIQLHLKLQNNDQVDNYLDKFNDFMGKLKGLNIPFLFNIESQYKISLARKLIQNKNFKTSLQAQELLNESLLLRPKIELRYDALILLIDITLHEYRAFENQETFETIKNLINVLGKLTERNPSIELQIHSLILEGKLVLISGNFTEFEDLLLKAQKLASTYNLEALENIIRHEYESFQKELGKWEELIDTNSSINSRLDMSKMESYVKDVYGLYSEELTKKALNKP